MKTFRLIPILLVSVIISCNTEPNKTETKQNDVEKIQIEEESYNKEQQYIFNKTLSFQNISFEIKTTGEGSIQKLTIDTKGLELGDDTINIEIDGEVVNAEVEDLNSDGFPEVLIYTVSAGSGSYGNVIGYSVNDGKSISQIYFPDLSEDKKASAGYMGHDKFAIVETSLVRKFPIYNEVDTNSNATGGTRQVQYKLKDGEASRLFVIYNTFDLQ